MQRHLILAIACVAGCGSSVHLFGTTHTYTPGGTEWLTQPVTLAVPRAAHAVLAAPGDAFLVIGGYGASPGDPEGIQLTLDIEQCTLAPATCTIVGQLARGSQQPEVARAPDGTIVISDLEGLQAFDPSSGVTTTLDVTAYGLVETSAGVVLLGVVGPVALRTNVAPLGTAVFRSSATGIEPFAAPPIGGTAAALDPGHVLEASNTGAALLDVATGAWTLLPAVPTMEIGLHAIHVGDGAVLVVADGDRSSYLFTTATNTWSAVPAPTIEGVVNAIGLSGGALVVTYGQPGDTYSLRLADLTWLQGPLAPPDSALDAITGLDDGSAIAVGGTDDDFIADASS